MLAALLILLAVLWGALQLPAVQNRIARETASYLSHKLGTPFSLDRAYIDFFNQLTLEGLCLEDLQGDTLLYAGRLQVQLSLFAPLQQQITVDNIALSNARARVYNNRTDATFNYQFLVDAFASDAPTDTTAQTSPWAIGLKDISLRDIRLSFADSLQEAYYYSQIGQLELQAQSFDLEQQTVAIRDLLWSDSYLEVKVRSEPSVAETPAQAQATGFSWPYTGWDISLGQMEWANLSVAFDDFGSPPLPHGNFDPAHIHLEELSLKGEGLSWSSAQLSAGLTQLAFREQNGFELRALGFQANLTPQSAQLAKLQFATPYSSLAPSTASLSFDDLNALSALKPNTGLSLDVPQLTLARQDLSYWAGALPVISNEKDWAINSTATLNGSLAQIKGKVSAQAGKAFALNLSGQVSAPAQAGLLSYEGETRAEGDFALLKPLLQKGALPDSLVQWGRFAFSATLRGSLEKLDIPVLELKTAASTSLLGQAKLDIPSQNRPLAYAFQCQALQSSAEDLRPFIGTITELERMGPLNWSGLIKGNADSIFIDGSLQTAAGQLSPSLSLSFVGPIAYSGSLNVPSFNLGQVLAAPTLGEVSLNAQFEGSGASPDSLIANLQLDVQQAGYNGYTYRGLQIRAKAAQGVYEGSISANDPLADLSLTGQYRSDSLVPAIALAGEIRYLDLQQLNLYPAPLALSVSPSVNIQGLHPDDLNGQALLLGLRLVQEEKQLVADRIALQARAPEGSQPGEIRLSSPFADATLSGSYELGVFPKHLMAFADTFFPLGRLLGQDVKSDALPLPAQAFEVSIKLKDTQAFTDLFLPALRLPAGAAFQARFDSEARLLNAELSVEALQYGLFKADTVAWAVYGDTAGIRQLLSAEKVWQDTTTLAQQLRIGGELLRDSLFGAFSVGPADAPPRLRAGMYVKALDSLFQLRLSPPFFLNGKEWQIPERHSLLFGQGYLYAHQVGIARNGNRVTLQSDSVSTEMPIPPLGLFFEDFRLQELSQAIGLEAGYLSGKLNGSATVSPADSLQPYRADLGIYDLTLDKVKLGDLRLRGAPDTKGNRINAMAKLQSGSKDRLIADLEYDLNTSQANGTIKADRMPVSPFDFFAQGSIRDSKGYLSADLKLAPAGEALPQITGTVSADSLSTFIDYLQARFTIPQHQINFQPGQILLGSIPLVDETGQQASLSGDIAHQAFSQFRLNLLFDAPNFQVMNTQAADNDLFFGKIQLGTTARLSGSPDDLRIDIQATTMPGTKLTVLPLTEAEAVTQEDYIIFGNPEIREAATADSLYQIAPAGYNISLQLNLTPEAEIIAIIDPATGDQLTARGKANIQVELLPNGNLSTTGTIEITKGSYQLNYEGLVKRKFEVAPGGTIFLPGDPLGARFDLAAIYRTEAPVLPILQQEATLTADQEQAARRRQPVAVRMAMTGTLEAPEIHFSLSAGEKVSGNLAELIQQKFNQLADEETELNKQVFGLLLFNAFLGGQSDGSLAAAGENIALSSVSSMLTNQLNRLAEQYVDGVDLNVGIDSYNTGGISSGETITELNLGLSKQLFNDRISVEVGGNVGVSESQASGQQTVLAGDFLLEYRITEDGRYRLRVFRRPGYDIFTNGTRTGASLLFRKSFGSPAQDTARISNPERHD